MITAMAGSLLFGNFQIPGALCQVPYPKIQIPVPGTQVMWQRTKQYVPLQWCLSDSHRFSPLGLFTLRSSFMKSLTTWIACVSVFRLDMLFTHSHPACDTSRSCRLQFGTMLACPDIDFLYFLVVVWSKRTLARRGAGLHKSLEE